MKKQPDPYYWDNLITDAIEQTDGPWINVYVTGRFRVSPGLLNALERRGYEVRQIIADGDGAFHVLARLREEVGYTLEELTAPLVSDEVMEECVKRLEDQLIQRKP